MMMMLLLMIMMGWELISLIYRGLLDINKSGLDGEEGKEVVLER